MRSSPASSPARLAGTRRALAGAALVATLPAAGWAQQPVPAGLGLGVGLLSYANNERKCRGCYNTAIVPMGVVAGAGLGFGTGTVVYLARRPRAAARATP